MAVAHLGNPYYSVPVAHTGGEPANRMMSNYGKLTPAQTAPMVNVAIGAASKPGRSAMSQAPKLGGIGPGRFDTAGPNQTYSKNPLGGM